MKPRQTVNQHEVLAVLAHNRGLHAYGICDVRQLWNTSTWWSGFGQVAGVIKHNERTLLYCIAEPNNDGVGQLLHWLHTNNKLPSQFDFALAEGFLGQLEEYGYTISNMASYKKMVAVPYPGVIEDTHCRVLHKKELPEIKSLFDTDQEAGTYFYPAMLESNAYVGKWLDDMLVAVSGVHFLDTVERIGTIGNVVVHPKHRGKGYGTIVVDAGLKVLHRAGIDLVGLNVKQSNEAAVAVYKKLGFRTVGTQVSGSTKT